MVAPAALDRGDGGVRGGAGERRVRQAEVGDEDEARQGAGQEGDIPIGVAREATQGLVVKSIEASNS